MAHSEILTLVLFTITSFFTYLIWRDGKSRDAQSRKERKFSNLALFNMFEMLVWNDESKRTYDGISKLKGQIQDTEEAQKVLPGEAKIKACENLRGMEKALMQLSRSKLKFDELVKIHRDEAWNNIDNLYKGDDTIALKVPDTNLEDIEYSYSTANMSALILRDTTTLLGNLEELHQVTAIGLNTAVQIIQSKIDEKRDIGDK